MKAIKNIYALFLGLLMLGLGSCMEETEVNGGEQNVDGLRLSLSVSASDVISPLTKASATAVSYTHLTLPTKRIV